MLARCYSSLPAAALLGPSSWGRFISSHAFTQAAPLQHLLPVVLQLWPNWCAEILQHSEPSQPPHPGCHLLTGSQLQATDRPLKPGVSHALTQTIFSSLLQSVSVARLNPAPSQGQLPSMLRANHSERTGGRTEREDVDQKQQSAAIAFYVHARG